MGDLRALWRSTGAARCVECGRCTATCPVAARSDYSARRFAGQDASTVLEGRGVGAYRCRTCGACEVRCPQTVHFGEYARGVRAQLPPEHRPPPPHDGVFEISAVQRKRFDRTWLGDDLQLADVGEVGLFVGCLPQFDAYFADELGIQTREIARSAVRLLNAAGIEPVIVEEERCCGHDLLWGGEQESFEALARANCEAFAARGIRHLVTTCAECCRTWRLDYPGVVDTYQPKVEHVAEFLSTQVAAGALQFEAADSEIYTFQDPCRLGRHLGVTEAPRRVLDALPGVELREMRRTEKDAVCCGTCGFVNCDATSRSMQAERLAEAAATGARTLITACPKCLIHFTCAQKEDEMRGSKRPTLEIRDLAVVAAGLLGGDGKQPGAPGERHERTGET